MDFTSSNKLIDLQQIKHVRTKEDFYNPTGGTVIDNYSNISTSDKLTELTVFFKEGINTIRASKNDLEVNFDNGSWRNNFTFSVPFTMANALKECSKCQTKLMYVNGIHQFIDGYGHFHNPEGWIETKNQYYCTPCGLYFVQTQRTFLFCTGGYNVLNTTLINKPQVLLTESKYRTPRVHVYSVKKSPEEMKERWSYSDEEMIYWEGECVVCQTKTQPFSEDGFGCVTGKTSLYGESVCPKCNLLHHAEEHGD